MIDGVPYNKLNIVYISSSKNNTILSLTDHNGLTLYSISAGACGFKNCKKSTAVAGQAAGLALSDVTYSFLIRYLIPFTTVYSFYNFTKRTLKEEE
jgi:ribosomal protein S11